MRPGCATDLYIIWVSLSANLIAQINWMDISVFFRPKRFPLFFPLRKTSTAKRSVTKWYWIF